MSNSHTTSALECLDPEGDFNWENSDLANIAARIEAQTQATLAVAHELKTANLLAAYAADMGSSSPLYNEIHDRLGLGGTK